MPQAVPDSEPPEHYDPRSNKFSPSVDGTGTWPTPISAEKISADKGFPSPASFGGNAPPAEQSTSRKTTIWGLRRRTFWIVLAVVVLVVIVALVGGLAGGLRSRNSDSDSASPPSPSPTGPLDPQQRAVGSASSGGSDGGALQLFYQDIDTTDILYRLSWGDSFGAEQRVDLTDVPNWGTPLATTTFARPGNQGLDVNLFYLSTNETNNITIVRTTLNCPQAAASCNTTSSEIISTTFRNGVHPSSGLTAILLNNSQDRFRVFFRATRGVVWSLVGDQPIENGWSFHQVGGPAPEGSSISASLRKGLDQIFVAFVLDDTGLLRSAEYNDSVGVKGGECFQNKLSTHSPSQPS